MATRTATRDHPVSNAFDPRRLGRGKAQQVALTAALRTLLIILQARVNTHTRWNAKVNHGPGPEPAR